MATQLNWAMLAFCYTHWDIGLVIVAVTNYPCHLTAYVTDKPPLKHRLTRVLRGLKTPWGAYFCFVAYTPYEQAEAGDTTLHTFHINDWLQNETRWWLLQGTMAGGQVSLSNSPIIEHKHPGGLPEYVDLRPNNPGDLCRIRNGVPDDCPLHWSNVNKAVPLYDESKVFNYWLATEHRLDLYHFDTIVDPNILNITVNGLFKSTGTRQPTRVCRFTLKTAGILFQGARFAVPDGWHYRSWSFDLNPVTGIQWTWPELNALQAGVGLSFISGLGWAQWGHCCQVYLTVHRGLCVPEVTTGPYP